MLCILALVLAGAVSYHNSLRGPFIFDDHRVIETNPHVLRLGPDTILKSSRPVVDLTFALNYLFHRLDVAGFHALNIFFHIGAGWMLMLMAREMLVSPRQERGRERTAAATAFGSALIWLTHPLNTQSVNYLSQRAEVMMGFLYVAVIYTYLRGHTTPLRKFRWHAASAGLYLLGLWCKGVMVTAPLMVLLADRMLFSSSLRHSIKKNAAYLSAMAACLVIWGLWFHWVLRDSSQAMYRQSVGFGMEEVRWFEYLRTQPEIILHYLRLAVWPSGLCLDYQWPVASDLTAIAVKAAVILGLIDWGCVLYRKGSIAGWWILWVFIILLPTSSAFPISDLAFEHRMYLSLAGVIVLCVMAAGALVRWILPSARYRSVMLTLLCGLAAVPLAWATLERNEIYRDNLAVWQDVLDKSKVKSRARLNLGVWAKRQGNEKQAADLFEMAVRSDPDDMTALKNLGLTLMDQGKYKEASEHFRRMILKDPRNYRAYHNIGLALQNEKRTDEAVEYYQKALSIYPTYAESINNLGNCYNLLGRYDNALEQFQKLLRITPKDADVYSNLGNVLSAMGQKEQAIAHYHEAIRLNPRLAQAHYNLGAIHYEMDNYEKAEEAFLQVLKIDPQFEPAKRSLDLTRQKLK